MNFIELHSVKVTRYKSSTASLYQTNVIVARIINREFPQSDVVITGMKKTRTTTPRWEKKNEFTS